MMRNVLWTAFRLLKAPSIVLIALAPASCTSILGASKVTGSSSTPGKLTVGVLVPVSGTWRLFLQVKIGGKTLTAPFTLHVS